MNGYRQIENLIYRYAESIDLGDFESLAELFREGEINWMADLWRKRGYQEVLEMTTAAIRIYEDTGTPCTKNIVSNMIIEIDEDRNTAAARSYFMVYQERADWPVEVIVSGRYHDTFVCRNQRWQFRERTVLTDFYGDMSRHLLISLEPEGINEKQP
ncbi:MAG: nuclear transport factor 2 family protein [Gammaproteobacteria bacterium]|uniref:nuclear transport factor 2 family protein n=1 Tax=Pseudomaricurvus alcaniphilus TaxID=1166482 RepID=UPI00140BBFC9|nr:nuclear transport factor 2 family protein [Pseudomaricurvus alcaniphilus]MBR9911077.1 nuclear transport factor 2 family protein [Gammaproteobacteria bacterium]NHN36419.1 nuclear transport factor 2 family protein [Pseudomaricurvus alcaniphilus]